MLSRINAQSEKCMFFDDRVKNLHPAHSLGIRSVLFNRERIDSAGFESVNDFPEIIEIFQKQEQSSNDH